MSVRVCLGVVNFICRLALLKEITLKTKLRASTKGELQQKQAMELEQKVESGSVAPAIEMRNDYVGPEPGEA